MPEYSLSPREITKPPPLPEWVLREPDPARRQTMERVVKLVRKTVATTDLVGEHIKKISGELYEGHKQDIDASQCTLQSSQTAHERVIKATQEAAEDLNRRAIQGGISTIELHAVLSEILQGFDHLQCQEILGISSTISKLAEKGILNYQKSPYLLIVLGNLPEVSTLKRLSGLLEDISQNPKSPNQGA